MPKHAKQIMDLETKREYSSMYKAGQDLAELVHGDPKNPRVWFAIARAFPNRFRTKDPVTGQWVPLSRPARKPRGKQEPVEVASAVAGTTTSPDSSATVQKDKPGVVVAADTNRAVATKGMSVKTTPKTTTRTSKHAPKKRFQKPPQPATKTSRKA